METSKKSLEEADLLNEKVFASDMGDPVIVIDKKHVPGYLRHRFYLLIENTCGSPLYFKLIEQIPNWELGTTTAVPADGKLGAIDAGKSKGFWGVITRNLPVGESEDVGHFIVEAYPDDTYTGLIESHSHPTTIYIEDLENWPDVQKWDFDDGTAQGWTLYSGMSISNEKSIESGYSVRYYHVRPSQSGWYYYPYLSRSVTLPHKAKVRLSFYFSGEWGGNGNVAFSYLTVLVNDSPIPLTHGIPFGDDKIIHWSKAGVDLSDYRGQTVTIKIRAKWDFSAYPSSVWGKWYLDNIVIAGK